ncbi:MAG: aminotransferase class V-fold PLP-dependent enzyme [Terrimicrobiaceae bacterium]
MRTFPDEAARMAAFPVARNQIFLAHAGVSILPACAADAISAYARASCEQHQEFGDVLNVFQKTRALCARFIGARAEEVALLGPTSLGLSLFANGLTWRPGDELVCYADDYPANVYPWAALASKGVLVRRLHTQEPGRITPEAVETLLTPKTRMVALASCHYLTGWRLDIDTIGKLLQDRGILFSVDAIQTVGAFPTNTTHVDFLSADAHKWMLGPMAIGIVFVASRNFEICEPTLLGAWNVRSPEFIAQDRIEFEPTARRYEPGVLNAAGIYGMKASLELLESVGSKTVSSCILAARDHLENLLDRLGFVFLSPRNHEPFRSGILTARHPSTNSTRLFEELSAAGITASLRQSRDGVPWLRFSPHFYNTLEEMEQVAGVLEAAL